MKTRPSTCLSVFTRHAIINNWWNSGPFEGRVQVPHSLRRTRYCAGGLYAIRDSMCVGGDRVFIKCESGNFRLHTPRNHYSARLFVGTEYISMTQLDMDYLVRLFHILQQQLRDYISALPDAFSYVTSSLASTSFVDVPPNSSTFINYPRLYEELVTFV